MIRGYFLADLGSHIKQPNEYSTKRGANEAIIVKLNKTAIKICILI